MHALPWLLAQVADSAADPADSASQAAASQSVGAATSPPPALGEDGVLLEGMIIAAIGLLIVFVALVLISLFIATLPRVLEMVTRWWPEVEEHHALEHRESDADEELAVLAAIGFVLHTEFQRQLGGESASKSAS